MRYFYVGMMYQRSFGPVELEKINMCVFTVNNCYFQEATDETELIFNFRLFSSYMHHQLTSSFLFGLYMKPFAAEIFTRPIVFSQMLMSLDQICIYLCLLTIQCVETKDSVLLNTFSQ